ncbi:MAG: hypothetical protein EOQ57_16950 [Mesorhizobium sp.]|nr:MAG: hypothetical protein EOQ57_16950 [Mesorhizobium sp.]
MPTHRGAKVLGKARDCRLAQLCAKRAMDYETICFRARRLRPLVLPVAAYGDCGTGMLCGED